LVGYPTERDFVSYRVTRMMGSFQTGKAMATSGPSNEPWLPDSGCTLDLRKPACFAQPAKLPQFPSLKMLDYYGPSPRVPV
jgi:hypothetical protein